MSIKVYLLTKNNANVILSHSSIIMTLGAQNYSSAEVNIETENKYLTMCIGTETTLTSCLFSSCSSAFKDSGVCCQPSGLLLSKG